MKLTNAAIVFFVLAPALVAASRAVPIARPEVPARRALQLAPARSVWDSVYTPDQAKRGQESYGQTCIRCHQASLGGADDSPPLTGSSFLANWYGQTLFDLHDRIRTTMPSNDPGTFDRQLITDVIAYVLSFNGFPAGTTELPKDADVLKDIRIEAKKP